MFPCLMIKVNVNYDLDGCGMIITTEAIHTYDQGAASEALIVNFNCFKEYILATVAQQSVP